MKEQTRAIYPFLKAARGNWRNALFVRLGDSHCPDIPDDCGFLFCADAEGKPLLVSAAQFYQITGEQVDPAECVSQLDWRAFASAYNLWLTWTV